jgi:hypothetical protein
MQKVDTAAAVRMMQRVWTIVNHLSTTSLATQSNNVGLAMVVAMAGGTIFRSPSLLQAGGHLGMFYGIGGEYRWQHNSDDTLYRGRAAVQLDRRQHKS